jgi:hypothetical protein
MSDRISKVSGKRNAAAQSMIRGRMFQIITFKETNQIAVVGGSELNNIFPEACRHFAYKETKYPKIFYQISKNGKNKYIIDYCIELNVIEREI